MISTHMELVKAYRDLESRLSRSLKSAKKLKKGQRLKSVKYDKNITLKSFRVLLERAKKIFPRTKVDMPVEVMRLMGDELLLGKILDKLTLGQSHVSGRGIKGVGAGAEQEAKAVAWWSEMIAFARASGDSASDIIRKLETVFGTKGAALEVEIDTIIQAIYSPRYSSWGGADGATLAMAVYEKAASVFGHRPGGASYPWSPSYTPGVDVPTDVSKMYKAYGLQFNEYDDYDDETGMPRMELF